MARTKTLTEENTENVVENTEQEIVENKEISVEKENENLKQKIETFEKQLKDAEKENENLKQTVEKLQNQINNLTDKKVAQSTKGFDGKIAVKIKAGVSPFEIFSKSGNKFQSESFMNKVILIGSEVYALPQNKDLRMRTVVLGQELANID